MSSSPTERNDSDYVQLKKGNIGFTGQAHIKKITIKTEQLPPLTFPKSSIAYIHFKQPSHQPVDYVQLKDGGSVSGEIVELDEVEFTIAGSGESVVLPRDTILVLKFDIAAGSVLGAAKREELLTGLRQTRTVVVALIDSLERDD